MVYPIVLRCETALNGLSPSAKLPPALVPVLAVDPSRCVLAIILMLTDNVPFLNPVPELTI